MRTILPFAGVILALIAAGSIAFLAWELTKDAIREGESDED
jgi:Na+-translocating ferredoxin:NAD+ oxidoreductase RnfG subunit